MYPKEMTGEKKPFCVNGQRKWFDTFDELWVDGGPGRKTPCLETNISEKGSWIWGGRAIGIVKTKFRCLRKKRQVKSRRLGGVQLGKNPWAEENTASTIWKKSGIPYFERHEMDHKISKDTYETVAL